MKHVALLIGIIVLASLAFWPLTTTVEGSVAATKVLGMPVLGVGADELCWLSLGFGYGVLFVGIAGAGGAAIGLGAGGGVLFGMGQLATGMMAIGQLGLGLVFGVVQLGVGTTGYGQLMLGVLTKTQLGPGKDGGLFLSQLSRDLDEVLSFR